MPRSIIVSTCNSDKFLNVCLKSIAASIHLAEYDYGIFVVDNRSTDQTREQISRYRESDDDLITTVLFDANTGTGYPLAI